MKRNVLTRIAVLGGTLAALATSGGCLSRPVGQQPPTTKVSFGTTVSQQAVDKVDLLFSIDNSASMGDKQRILAEAVPNLVQGLLNPRCVNADGVPSPGGEVADPNSNVGLRYGCPTGTEPEFKPISDMHIGIVSSSLGSFAGDVCPDAQARANDRGRLLNYTRPAGMTASLSSSNFLAWFPQNEENNDKTRHPDPEKPVRDIATLTAAFQALVEGTDQTGCGLEAQLESWYHFLVQPDPWESVKRDANDQAILEGVDVALLRQRADFLRPDSLVAIIVLTDEDDSSADPLAVGGQGWAFMARDFPGSNIARGGNANAGRTAPRATTQCAQNPGAKDDQGRDLCTSCGFKNQCNASDPACQRIKDDANCKEVPAGVTPPAGTTEGYAGYYGPNDDSLNVRFHRMKERFGIDPQYPLQRYIDGLQKPRVPDRTAEHPETKLPSGRRDIKAYVSAPKCTNPLFAAKLPREPGDELCNLPRSTRSPDLVFFAVVGGVPNQLLHFNPTDPEASRITDGDWIKILGRDPRNFNYEGIDPHMIQSVAPRPEIAAGPSDVRGQNGNDPIHGREWNTNKEDLQYACTFDLPTTSQRTCNPDDPSCDCGVAGKNPPLCNSGNTQIKAKAYPTIREFQVVRAIGDQGVIASLCPIQLNNQAAPDYGYKPAVAAIIDRLKNALTTQCLPQPLARDEATQEVPCLILAQLAEPTDTCAQYNLKPPPKEILDIFLEEQRATSGGATGTADLSKLPVCEVEQMKDADGKAYEQGESCKDRPEIGWCYVQNTDNATPAGRKCSQAIIFSTGSKQLIGARFTLQCINNLGEGQAAGDKP